MAIMKAMLSPTEYRMLSIKFILWTLRILRINSPGTKAKKRNSISGVSIGISKPRLLSSMKTSAVRSRPKHNARHFFICQSLGGDKEIDFIIESSS